MIKRYVIVILALIFGPTLCAQEERQLIQTNLLSLASTMPSLNIGYVRYNKENTRFLEASANVYIAMMPGLRQDVYKNNRYAVMGLENPSFEVKFGYRSKMGADQKQYMGYDVKYALMMFKNTQTICTESEWVNTICFCRSYMNNDFTSYNHRIAAEFTLGTITEFDNGMSLDFNFKTGFGYYIRTASNNQEHKSCNSLSQDEVYPKNWNINHRLYGKAANLYANTNSLLYFQLGLNLRFKRW